MNRLRKDPPPPPPKKKKDFHGEWRRNGENKVHVSSGVGVYSVEETIYFLETRLFNIVERREGWGSATEDASHFREFPNYIRDEKVYTVNEKPFCPSYLCPIKDAFRPPPPPPTPIAPGGARRRPERQPCFTSPHTIRTKETQHEFTRSRRTFENIHSKPKFHFGTWCRRGTPVIWPPGAPSPTPALLGDATTAGDRVGLLAAACSLQSLFSTNCRFGFGWTGCLVGWLVCC